MGRRTRLLLAFATFATVALSASSAAARLPYYLSNNPPIGPAKPGVVITVHGGGWGGNYGPSADLLMSSYIHAFQSWGYRDYNLAHRPGRLSLVDMIDAVEHVSSANPGKPLCLFGGSSGGHLVLMAAIERPKLVDCVIDQAGIPDLVRPDSTEGWQHIHDLAVDYWGRRHLRDVSPMQHARELKAPVLVIAPDCDFATSVARQQKLVRKLRRGKLFVEHGGVGYDTGHCEVASDSIAAGNAAMHQFLDRHAG